jgi:hypothetical protein
MSVESNPRSSKSVPQFPACAAPIAKSVAPALVAPFRQSDLKDGLTWLSFDCQ